MKLASLVRSLKFRGRGRASGKAALVRLLLTGAVVLAQIQLLWLAGFHYHPEVSVHRRSPATTVGDQAHRSPADDGSSCPFCQLLRHSTSTPQSTIVLVFDSASNTKVTPHLQTEPAVAPHVRLAGRDPPLSLLANC